MATSHLIYALVDPRTGLVNYIGKSSSGLKRPNGHMSKARLMRDQTTKGDWLRQLAAFNLRCLVHALEHVEHAFLLDDAEQRWIERGRAENWPLTNMTDGGDGPHGRKMSEEQKQRMRAAWASGERKHTPETIEKLRALKTGVPRSEETKAKIRTACRRPEAIKRMSAANRGRQRTEEHQRKITEANIGKYVSPETRAKQGAARRGRKHSPEALAKMSAAKRGKPRPDLVVRNQSPEARAHLDRLHAMARGRPRPDLAERNRSQAQRDAVSKALDGRVFSEETLEKMSQGQRRRWKTST